MLEQNPKAGTKPPEMRLVLHTVFFGKKEDIVKMEELVKKLRQQVRD